MPEDVASPYLDTWKDWEPEIRLWVKDTATRDWKPATGLLGITFRVSLTEQGAAIGNLTGIPTAEALGDDGLGGYYYAQVDLALLASELPENEFPNGKEVFLQVFKPGDIQVEAIRKVIRRSRYS